MIVQDAKDVVLGFWNGKRLNLEAVDDRLTSDGGLIAFGQLDQTLGWTNSFCRLVQDSRSNPAHSLLSMVRQRVFGIIAGYEDQNDHDALRSDPMFKLLADREPAIEPDLASQPTLSRMENSITASDLLRLEDWFIDRFVESFLEEPSEIVLDIDTFDDQTHGAQQLTFFHNFYEQFQYQIRVVTCANNDMTVLPVLLHGTASATLGAEDDLVRVIGKIRERFPCTRIHVRGDAAYGSDRIFDSLESLSGVTYSIGYKCIGDLQRESSDLFNEMKVAFESTRKPQIACLAVDSYKPKKWDVQRVAIVKCEVNDVSSARRAIITNRPGARTCPEGAYFEYADRGESENRHKELKCELRIDRLSDHRYMANLFRVMLHTLAANLLVAMRRVVADPPNEVATDTIAFDAGPELQKRQIANRRRRADPLGEGHACTWRTLVIKVAARIQVTTRRVRVIISSHWPNHGYLQKVLQELQQATVASNTG